MNKPEKKDKQHEHDYRLMGVTKRGYLEGSNTIADFYCIKCLEVVKKMV